MNTSQVTTFQVTAPEPTARAAADPSRQRARGDALRSHAGAATGWLSRETFAGGRFAGALAVRALVGAAALMLAGLAGASAEPAASGRQDAAPAAAASQEAPPPEAAPEKFPEAAAPADASTRKRDTESELTDVRRSMTVSAERQAELKAEIDALDKDHATLSETLIATGERIAKLEAAVAAGDARLARARDNAAAIRLSLDERRGVLTEVIAALERIGRRPPPALLVEPTDARRALRSGLLLGAVLPEIRVEAEALAADLAALSRLETEIAAERAARAADLAKLDEERARIALLVEEKRRLRSASAEALAAESRAAEALAGKAKSLEDLIGGLERDIASARAAATAARLAQPGGRAATADPHRLSPQVAFAAAKGTLALPVSGTPLHRFGDPDGAGGRSQGVTLAAQPGAQVTAPADGWAVYAGPFRSYGQILILNMGGGYHVLLAGMDRIDVDLGQFVLAGEPVGSMGGSASISAAAFGSDAGDADTGRNGAGQNAATGQVLYVEFRKDGSSIDSAPWWAARQDEEVRG